MLVETINTIILVIVITLVVVAIGMFVYMLAVRQKDDEQLPIPIRMSSIIREQSSPRRSIVSTEQPISAPEAVGECDIICFYLINEIFLH